jgi:hypothetical protein
MTEKKDTKPIKKHVPQPACVAGGHTYFVTSWRIGGGQQKAQMIRCRNCLMPLDMEEVESAEWSRKEGLDV